MTKRKQSTEGASPAKEVAAAEQKTKEIDPYAPGPIDTNPLQFLIEPQELSSFVSKHWERAPLHVPANDERKKFFEGLFDLDALAQVADQLEAGCMILMDQDPGEKGDALTLDDDVDDAMIREVGPLQFGRDVVAVRYIDGKKETIAGDAAESSILRKLHDKAGATLQLHQPQRFINGLWRLVAAMEAQSGCLVGCNAYVTPPKGQGLAPHHDDVELFVCQTQGVKKWRLYKPVGGFELPNKCSGDLPQDILGEPIMEVTMSPGDVLYIPRGTVHQAVAQEEGSCHLTISTYQNWTWGDLAGAIVETAREAQGEHGSALPLELRRGLPMGLIWQQGLQADLAASDPAAVARPVATTLAAGLRALAAQLEECPAELITPAVDEMALDFLRSRMPPHPAQLPDQGEEPELEDSLAVRGRNLFRLVPVEDVDDDMDEDEEDEDEEEEGAKKEKKEKEPKEKVAYVKLVTCLMNSRYKHMMSGASVDEDDDEDGHHHHHHHDSPCGECSEGEEGEEEEDEEEDKEEKAEAADKEAADKKKDKKGAKEESEEPEIMEVSENDEDEDDEGEDGDSDGDSDEEEEEEDEEPELIGPMFPAAYAPVLTEVLASTLERLLPVKALKVPGMDPKEQFRLARILHEFGAVITVPGKKEEAKKVEAAEAAPASGEKASKRKGKAEEAAKGSSPPSKKAKKGAK